MTSSRLAARIKNMAIKIWPFAIIFVVWELIADALEVFYFPPLTSIVATGYKLWLSGPASSGWITQAAVVEVLPSLVRLAAGFAMAAIGGILFGFMIGRSRILSDFLDPIVHFMRSVPPVALVPIFMLLFGIGTEMRILLIAFTSIWPILLNTIDGVREIEPTYLQTARIYGIKRWRILHSIVLPYTLPRIFDGLRISSALALIVMVLSEMIAATSGIGYSLTYAQQSFRYTEMWAYIVLLGLLGWALNAVIRWPERTLLKWQPGRKGE